MLLQTCAYTSLRDGDSFAILSRSLSKYSASSTLGDSKKMRYHLKSKKVSGGKLDYERVSVIPTTWHSFKEEENAKARRLILKNKRKMNY